ncbi:MAG: UDP-2,3-diacylglucosamine diphosphatase LpxI [Acidobacteriales bacterium]|nr:UDP-2,3-diacylglucosamine diphosphatase LpxI [Terriglobales bacterium]MCI0626207.1 UDP-2,3-diacylglucosamine diphosphatase LpxI [Acidobacteriota bacterium]MCI0718022.1 UDP-2,3-diacylglucosamine diphosphatase LpxI [Acidobacteriota bacterium]
MRYGLIAGNGKFPFLVLDAARSQGIDMVVAAIKEEAFEEIDSAANTVHWVGLGQLGKLIRIFKQEGVTQAIMAGQVKHKQIFSSIVPDLKLVKLLASLASKNTDSLIGAVASMLEEEGIALLESTAFLKPLLPEPGTLTVRAPNDSEIRDIEYGRNIAREIARMDIGQSVVVRDQACVAVEAMEGTDAVIRRAAALAGNQPITVVKVSKPHQDMRFDVPVVGLPTVELMAEANATALAIDARRTLLIDREKLVAFANARQISIIACEPD